MSPLSVSGSVEQDDTDRNMTGFRIPLSFLLNFLFPFRLRLPDPLRQCGSSSALTVHPRHYRASLSAFNFAEADFLLYGEARSGSRGATVRMYAVLDNKPEEYMYSHPLGCSKFRNSQKSRLTHKPLIISIVNVNTCHVVLGSK